MSSDGGWFSGVLEGGCERLVVMFEVLGFHGCGRKEIGEMSKEKPEDKGVQRDVVPVVKRRVVELMLIGESILVTKNGASIVADLKNQRITQGDDGSKKLTKRTKKGAPIDPHEEYMKSRYIIDNKTDGFPAFRIKEAAVTAAHTLVPEISKIMARVALWVKAPHNDFLVPILSDAHPPAMHEGTERVGGKGPGTGAPDLRWRAKYSNWRIPVAVEYLASTFTEADVINLFNFAGLVGIGEHRPSKNGDWGRFRVEKRVSASDDKVSGCKPGPWVISERITGAG